MKKTYHEIDIEEMKRTADAVGYKWLLIFKHNKKDEVECECIEASRIDELTGRYWKNLESKFESAILTSTLPMVELVSIVTDAEKQEARLLDKIYRLRAKIDSIPNYKTEIKQL